MKLTTDNNSGFIMYIIIDVEGLNMNCETALYWLLQASTNDRKLQGYQKV
jgi:hypothetical protein